MNPWLLLGGIAVALLGVAIAWPSVQTVLDQAELMAGVIGERNTIAQRQALGSYLAGQTWYGDVRNALRAALRKPGEVPAQSADRANGLYAYLRLLALLPAANTAPTTQPAGDAELVEQIRALQTAPPVRLYAAKYWSLAWATLQVSGATPRWAAYDADLWTSSCRYDFAYARLYRPVVRRLAQRLLAQAQRWRAAGRTADALAADAAVARLMLDLVDDSPRPDIVLVGGRYLIQALEGLAADAAAAKLPAEVAQDCATQQARVEAMRKRWHETASDDATLLPHGSMVVLPDRVTEDALGAIIASAYVGGAWPILGGLVFLYSLFSAGFWGSGETLRWRWGGWGWPVAVGIVVGPMVIAVLMLLFAPLSLSWLYSMNSAWALAGALLAVPVLLGLATRVCVILPEAESRVWPPRKAVLVMAAVAALLLVVIAAVPASAKPGHPPAGVQLLRRVGGMLFLESLVLMPLWVIWGGFRRRQQKCKRGPRAAAVFSTAVWSWAAATVLAMIVLQVNAHRDLRHEQAYVAAAQDPLAVRLGPSWRAEYFQGARELLKRVSLP